MADLSFSIPLFTAIAMPFAIMFFAIMLDAIAGEPDFLWSRLPHPVVVFGKAISFLEKRLNQRRFSGRQRRFFGTISLILWVGVALIIGFAIEASFSVLPEIAAFIIEVILVAILLAGRSLIDHIKAVAVPLSSGDIAGARFAVSMIVGRDTSKMEDSDIARAAIETGAENLSDGVFAPALWYLIGGLPLMLAYKMVNTADSMVGYKSARYYAFGWASAIFDDVVNYFPARLTGLLIIAVGKNPKQALSVMRADADHHASPNAGYPEAAMAGSLGIRLGGTRAYRNRTLDLPAMMPAGRDVLSAADILASIKILWFALSASAILCLLIAFAFSA